jgi:hypothetical protein
VVDPQHPLVGHRRHVHCGDPGPQEAAHVGKRLGGELRRAEQVEELGDLAERDDVFARDRIALDARPQPHRAERLEGAERQPHRILQLHLD